MGAVLVPPPDLPWAPLQRPLLHPKPTEAPPPPGRATPPPPFPVPPQRQRDGGQTVGGVSLPPSLPSPLARISLHVTPGKEAEPSSEALTFLVNGGFNHTRNPFRGDPPKVFQGEPCRTLVTTSVASPSSSGLGSRATETPNLLPKNRGATPDPPPPLPASHQQKMLAVSHELSRQRGWWRGG